MLLEEGPAAAAAGSWAQTAQTGRAPPTSCNILGGRGRPAAASCSTRIEPRLLDERPGALAWHHAGRRRLQQHAVFVAAADSGCAMKKDPHRESADSCTQKCLVVPTRPPRFPPTQ